MSTEPVGYARLISRFDLRALLLGVSAEIDTSVRGRSQTQRGEQRVEKFQTLYRPENSVAGDLQFALRYEGVNLEVLALLFAHRGAQDVLPWITSQPGSVYARRIAFLYEWTTGSELQFHSKSRAAYVPIIDTELQFALAGGARNAKFRVLDNLPGNRDFCPLTRRTDYLRATLAKDLPKRTEETLAKYDHELLRRAAAFLYLKETQSSFEVEREKPSASRAQRFADLLRQAERNEPLSEDRFVGLQNAVVDDRFREASYRTQQNWVGDDLGYRKRIAFVPPRPDDVRTLMDGLIVLSERLRKAPEHLDAIIAAAAISFGFVFIHPFMDGNGRLHRYLIHEVLSTAGFTPKGIVLPISTVILANLNEYVAALESFSKPLAALTTYDPDSKTLPTGNDALYFRYFDSTPLAEFLCFALERTIEHDLDEEMSFLMGFDKARTALANEIDWPAHSLDLFIRVVQQNGFKLSKSKRDSHFSWMKDEEAERFEKAVEKSFQKTA
jgi:hypothetical protein